MCGWVFEYVFLHLLTGENSLKVIYVILLLKQVNVQKIRDSRENCGRGETAKQPSKIGTK